MTIGAPSPITQPQAARDRPLQATTNTGCESVAHLDRLESLVAAQADDDGDEDFKRLWELGARAITLWRLDSAGVAHETSSVGEMDSELLERAATLVSDSLAIDRPVSRMLSSANTCFLVACPIPADAQEAISVVFPLRKELNRKQMLEAQGREVRLAAAGMAIERFKIQCQTQLAEPPSKEPIVSSAAHGFTWSEIGRFAGRKLVQAVDLRGASNRYRALLVLAIMAVALLPWPHMISAKVTCEPALRRFVAAPFDSSLLEARAVAGDQVVQGQVLAVLDGREIRGQLASLRAKLSQAQQRRTAAMAAGDPSAAELERLEVEHLQREVDLLGDRQQRLQIRSPIAGIVVSGDLSRVEGAPLTVGETLFEIAPLERLIAEVAIPEADVSYVSDEMKAVIHLEALPNRTYSAKLHKLHPRSEMRDETCVFVAEATLENEENNLRPGMNGRARIDAGYQPLVWILLHKPYAALRQTFGW